jgi:excisionase family DNA binding protein
MLLTMGQAARLAGVGKSTLSRAIKSGRLSATRQEDGSFRVDVAELSRIYSIRTETPGAVVETRAAVHQTTPAETPRDPELLAKVAALEAQIAAMNTLIEEVRRARDKAEAGEAQWREQAAEVKRITGPNQRPWWRRLVG